MSETVSRSLQILFLVSAHNGLSQRAQIALIELGHDVTVMVVDSAAAMSEAVDRHDPELTVCPFLKRLIPETIWRNRLCLIVHPGPIGDRGPSSLDWAIELSQPEWGVTVLVANGEFDAGEALATRSFPMRDAGKASLYRHEVRRAAIQALLDAVRKVLAAPPLETCRLGPGPAGRARPLMGQPVRAIDWYRDGTDTVLRKLRAGEGHPGVLDSIGGRESTCSMPIANGPYGAPRGS
jgi:putative two-component system hydrogenase maturation factor HypX/HoxX